MNRNIFSFLFYLLAVGVSETLKTNKDSSDLIYGLSHCRYNEIKSNVTTDPSGTCGCYLRTVMSKEMEAFACNTPIDVGCNVGLIDGYVVENGQFLQKTSPSLNEDCVRIKSVFVWNLLNKQEKKGIWMDITNEVTKYISLEPGSQIRVQDLDVDRWKGHVLKINFGCINNCTIMQCKHECTILKISGYREYPFALAGILGMPCLGFLTEGSFLTLLLVLGILLFIMIILNCCLFWYCCGCKKKCYPKYNQSERNALIRGNSGKKTKKDSLVIAPTVGKRQSKEELQEHYGESGGVYLGGSINAEKHCATSDDKGGFHMQSSNSAAEETAADAKGGFHMRANDKTSKIHFGGSKDGGGFADAAFVALERKRLGEQLSCVAEERVEEPLLAEGATEEELHCVNEAYFDDDALDAYQFQESGVGLRLGHQPAEDNPQSSEERRPPGNYISRGENIQVKGSPNAGLPKSASIRIEGVGNSHNDGERGLRHHDGALATSEVGGNATNSHSSGNQMCYSSETNESLSIPKKALDGLSIEISPAGDMQCTSNSQLNKSSDSPPTGAPHSQPMGNAGYHSTGEAIAQTFATAPTHGVHYAVLSHDGREKTIISPQVIGERQPFPPAVLEFTVVDDGDDRDVLVKSIGELEPNVGHSPNHISKLEDMRLKGPREARRFEMQQLNIQLYDEPELEYENEYAYEHGSRAQQASVANSNNDLTSSPYPLKGGPIGKMQDNVLNEIYSKLEDDYYSQTQQQFEKPLPSTTGIVSQPLQRQQTSAHIKLSRDQWGNAIEEDGALIKEAQKTPQRYQTSSSGVVSRDHLGNAIEKDGAVVKEAKTKQLSTNQGSGPSRAEMGTTYSRPEHGTGRDVGDQSEELINQFYYIGCGGDVDDGEIKTNAGDDAYYMYTKAKSEAQSVVNTGAPTPYPTASGNTDVAPGATPGAVNSKKMQSFDENTPRDNRQPVEESVLRQSRLFTVQESAAKINYKTKVNFIIKTGKTLPPTT